MICTGTLKIITDGGTTILMCSEDAGHRRDHYDAAFSIRWPDDAVIGTCRLPPSGGTERIM
jgi:hypothetical protein